MAKGFGALLGQDFGAMTNLEFESQSVSRSHGLEAGVKLMFPNR